MRSAVSRLSSAVLCCLLVLPSLACSKKKSDKAVRTVQESDPYYKAETFDLSLPGTEPLPESYNETSIHMILKDANWAYVFWSLSSQLASEFEDGSATLVLRNIRMNSDQSEQASYDIEVTPSDDNWTIELPHLGYSYQVSLVLKKGEEEKVLCKSSTVSTTKSWLSAHPDELRDSTTFMTLLSPLVLKGGTVLENKQIQDLIDIIDDDSTEAEVSR